MAKVLIVEDSESELLQLMKMVKALGHDVLAARSGEEGVSVATNQQPEVIVMDVVMPGVNGFQATRQIKHSQATKHIPVILASVKSQPVDIAWGQRQGAENYLVKPVLVRQLSEALEAVLASPGQATA